MAKKKNSKKKGSKVGKIVDNRIQEQTAEVKAPEVIDAGMAEEKVSDHTLVMEPVSLAEEVVQAPIENAEAAEAEHVITGSAVSAAEGPAAPQGSDVPLHEPETVAAEAAEVQMTEATVPEADVVQMTEALVPEADVVQMTETTEPEAAAEQDPADITDFILVSAPPEVIDAVNEGSAEAFSAFDQGSGEAVDAFTEVPAEAAGAYYQGPADPASEVSREPAKHSDTAGREPVTTALTQVIPAAGGQETKKRSMKPSADRIRKAFSGRPVTGRMLAAALAVMLILNGAVTAGIMALYSKSIKDDITAVSNSVRELDYNNSYDRGDSGMEIIPPDWNDNDNGWNDDFWGGYDWYDDDRDEDSRDNDDWYDDWYGSEEPDDQDDDQWDRDDQPGQQSSSGPSIGIVISDDNGVYVTQVTGTNAQKAGFESGDKIISFDGKNISDSNSLIAEVRSHSSGDRISVIVERDGKEVTINTELE